MCVCGTRARKGLRHDCDSKSCTHIILYLRKVYHPVIMRVQYVGVSVSLMGVQYIGGCLEYNGGMFSTSEDIMSYV